MDWSNERYVRLYTRETTTWKLLPWEGQALLAMLLRIVDRAGVLDLGGVTMEEAVCAAFPKWPPDVVEIGLAALEKRGFIEAMQESIVIPNFLEAQEAQHSAAQRQRDSRERRRAKARDGQSTAQHPVASRDSESRDTVEQERPCDKVLQDTPPVSLLPSLAVPSLAVPTTTSPPDPDPDQATPSSSSSSRDAKLERAAAIDADTARREIARSSVSTWALHREQVDSLCNEVRLSLPQRFRSRVPQNLAVGGGQHGAETLENFAAAVVERGISEVLEIIGVTLRDAAAGKPGLKTAVVACMFRGGGWSAAVNRWEASRPPPADHDAPEHTPLPDELCETDFELPPILRRKAESEARAREGDARAGGQ